MPTTGFRRLMFFNRFGVEREAGFVHISFGYANKTNVLLDSYSTVISEMELQAIQKVTMDYLGTQGTLLDPPPAWQPVAAIPTELSNHIVMARHGAIAETLLYSFSFWSAMQDAKRVADPDPKVPLGPVGIAAEPIALLRSPLHVQQHLIRSMFSMSEQTVMEAL